MTIPPIKKAREVVSSSTPAAVAILNLRPTVATMAMEGTQNSLMNIPCPPDDHPEDSYCAWEFTI